MDDSMDALRKLIVYYMLHSGCNKEDAIAGGEASGSTLTTKYICF